MKILQLFIKESSQPLKNRRIMDSQYSCKIFGIKKVELHVEPVSTR